MKKFIALLFVSVVATQGLLAIEPVSFSTPSNMGFEFIIDLHTPRSQCTKYLGICKLSFCVTLDFTDGSLGSGFIPCSITLNRNNELIIQLSESNISKYDPALLKFFAGKTWVVMDDTYDITEEISKGMQPQGRVVIRPGTYPLSYQHGIYTLTFPL
ncbi:MAG: hypothetical protein D4R67_06125 [Bacteroidetes bacterium]|nr:MAG: hypothetical protein D4R67_06125 [Bacteroidota bacterium]